MSVDRSVVRSLNKSVFTLVFKFVVNVCSSCFIFGTTVRPEWHILNDVNQQRSIRGLMTVMTM